VRRLCARPSPLRLLCLLRATLLRSELVRALTYIPPRVAAVRDVVAVDAVCVFGVALAVAPPPPRAAACRYAFDQRSHCAQKNTAYLPGMSAAFFLSGTCDSSGIAFITNTNFNNNKQLQHHTKLLAPAKRLSSASKSDSVASSTTIVLQETQFCVKDKRNARGACVTYRSLTAPLQENYRNRLVHQESTAITK
jgi:hypothetical protein